MRRAFQTPPADTSSNRRADPCPRSPPGVSRKEPAFANRLPTRGPRMNALLLSFALFTPAQPPADNDVGVLPVGADGKPLNLDFETGDLRDWTAEGAAFKDQPIKGDTVAPRRGDMKSRHQGNYWIGGYEKYGDKPMGTLTSVPFKVTHPWASFLIGGGPHANETCVELVDVARNAIFHRSAGLEEEDMKRV